MNHFCPSLGSRIGTELLDHFLEQLTIGDLQEAHAESGNSPRFAYDAVIGGLPKDARDELLR